MPVCLLSVPIFMAGSQDGHLYELHHQEREGWLWSPRSVNQSFCGYRSFARALFRRVASLLPKEKMSSILALAGYTINMSFRCHHVRVDVIMRVLGRLKTSLSVFS